MHAPVSSALVSSAPFTATLTAPHAIGLAGTTTGTLTGTLTPTLAAGGSPFASSSAHPANTCAGTTLGPAAAFGPAVADGGAPDRDAVLAHLGLVARGTIGLLPQFPRLRRLMGSQQRWLLCQAAFALHHEGAQAGEETEAVPGLTAGHLLDLILEYHAASRNTVSAFVQEMRAARVFTDLPSRGDRRVRPLAPGEAASEAMRQWFLGQLQVLDVIDGGARACRLMADPALIAIAQPLAARTLMADDTWREPAGPLGCILWTDAGNLLIDDLMARAATLAPASGIRTGMTLEVEEFGVTALADRYAVSCTHVRRLCAQAEETGMLLRTGKRSCRRLIIAPALTQAYADWQARRLTAIDAAFRAALSIRSGAAEPPVRARPRLAVS